MAGQGVGWVESEVRSQKSEVRSQESGVRSQESGVRSQRSGVRSQELGVSPLTNEAGMSFVFCEISFTGPRTSPDLKSSGWWLVVSGERQDGKRSQEWRAWRLETDKIIKNEEQSQEVL